MARISTYEVVPVPKLADKLIGTSVGGEIEDITYNFTLIELLNLFLPNIPANNLQGILDYGNTATQDIILYGTIYTTNIEVTSTATLLDSYFNGDTHILGALYDINSSKGLAAQVLTSTGNDVEWVTLPPIFTPDLQQVLTVGNTANLDIILTANIQALDINIDTATVNNNITIDGTITDGYSSIGTSNQVLSSTGIDIKWVNLPVYSATSPLFLDSLTGIFSIQQSSGTQSGYLSASDWITFNGKQNAGNYITALTGEATATGPGSVAITLSNPAVTGKVLTGLSITGGSISASDSILSAFGKVQSQLNALVGGVIFKGVWNAFTNIPTLTSSVGTQGWYYIVDVAGTTNLNGITDWQVGDWAIFNGSTWNKIDNTDLVTSVNGQTGAVSLTTDNISEGSLNLYFTDTRARNSVSATTPLAYNNISGVFSIQVATTSQSGYLTSTDWTTFNSKQNALSGTGLVKSTSGVITYITDNSSNWNTAYNDSIVSAAVTGTSTKTLTLNQQDGGTITASWSDADTGLTSVGLSMPVAFSVANTPLTANGTLAVTAIGTAAQYIRGDGQLATLPSNSGGGSSVFYYLNGSIAASVATYKQMANTAVIGAGTNFNLTGNGLIAQFLTDAGNPNRLEIPGGAWNFEMFFSMSSSGGTPQFYVELLKYDGVVFTSIANGSAVPEAINGGTPTDLYLSSLAVPTTTLLLTDRLAVRVYIVNNSGGRTATLHTEDNNLCQITTTFSAGISAINGLISNNQYLAVGTSGTDFAINSLFETHTFNLPTASATNRGALSSADWTTFNNKFNLPSLTAGSVLFSNGTTIAQNNANFFWDDTNTRLGLGTTTIGSKLQVNGNAAIGYSASTAAPTNGLAVAGAATFGSTLSSSTLTVSTGASSSTSLFTSSNIGTTIMELENSYNWNSANFTGYRTEFFFNGDKENRYTSAGAILGPLASIATIYSNSTFASDADQGAGALVFSTRTGTATTSSNVLTERFRISSTGAATFSDLVGTGNRMVIANSTGILSTQAITVGTVTSVAALTLGTTGTDLSSTVATGTTTPVITLQVPTASATNRGALSSADWTTFNGKFNLPSLTTGSVLFSNGTTIVQDNANFFWDDTNNRLGIGTAIPADKLSVKGGSLADMISWTDSINNTGHLGIRSNAASIGADNNLVFETAGTEKMRIATLGAVTISDLAGTGNRMVIANSTGILSTQAITVGTVTSVAALNVITAGTDLSSSVANPTTTPVITLQVPTASATNRGALSSTDWTTFNNKQNAITLTTTGISGAATLVGATLNIPQYQAAGTYVSSVTGTSPIVSSGGTTPAISIPAATTSINGYLTSTDWTTFNNKITLSSPITGYVVGSNTALVATDTLNAALGKLQGQVSARGVGTVTSVAALTLGTTGTDLSSTVATGTTTPVITLNVPTASATARGALSSADWTTFNNKANALSGTLNTIAKFTGTSAIGNSNISDDATVISLSLPTGVGNAKAPFAGPILTSTITNGGSGYVSGTYTDVATTATSGFGGNAIYTIIVTAGIVTSATLIWGGEGYAVGATMTVSNTLLGGSGSGLIITVNTVNSSMLTVSATNIGADINLHRSDGTMVADESMGLIKWSNNDASTKASGINATIGAYAAGSVGGGYLSFATRSATAGTSLVEAMRISSDGNVGIGVTSPNVSGQAVGVGVLTVKGNSSWGSVEVSNNASTLSAMLLGFYGFTNSSLSAGYRMPAYIGSWLEGGGVTSGGDLRFHTQVSGTAGATESMRIFSNGNVLIQRGGTFTNAGYDLDVNGTFRATDAATFSSGIATNGYTASTSYAGLFNGNVGIGTISPAVQLEVMSTTGGTLRLKRDDVSVTTDETIGTMEFYTNDADGAHVASYIKGLGADVSGSNFGRYGAMSFGVSKTANTDAVEAMRIDLSGNLGLGTSTIDSKLQVNGNAAIGYSASTAAPANGLAVAGVATFASRLNVNGATDDGSTALKVTGQGSFTDNLTVNSITVGDGAGTGVQNTVVGSSSLSINTTGNNNTAIGFEVLKFNTTGYYNTAIGSGALVSNSSGIYNTANGALALVTNTTGNYNTADGVNALQGNTTGTYNTASGVSSLASNTTTSYNSAFGATALFSNSTGANNTAIGYAAGYGTGTNPNTTGSNNIFIGYTSVGISSTESNRTWIGNSATASTWLGGNVHIGNTTDNGLAKLQVTGNVQLTTAGNKLLIATGTNASVGSATLIGGTVTVNTTAVTNSSGIFLTAQSGVNIGVLKISARVNTTSFTITSTSATDTAIVGWLIIN